MICLLLSSMPRIKHNIFHIAGWIALYLFWIMLFQKRTLALSHTASVEFCYLIFIAINFYGNVLFSIPKFLYKQKYLEFVLLFFSGIIITASLRVPLASFLNAHYFLVGKPHPTSAALFVASFINIFVWTACIVCAKIILDRYRLQEHLEKIKKEKSKAELDFLNAQLNPHFLFNSLHSIYGHIDKNNSAARNMLLSFSDMLRYQLHDCNNKSIPIEKELNYIKQYVNLQKTRKEEDLVVTMHIEESVKRLSIAPLLFICFVENAFKFAGYSKSNENKIDISFCRSEGKLVFTCFNTKEQNHISSIEQKGIGINNTKRRLALHYPDKHLLSICEKEDSYQVTLKIDLHEMEMHHN